MTEERKQDHIELAFKSQTSHGLPLGALHYEPMLGSLDLGRNAEPFSFVGGQMRWPFWVSSMTGGTQKANRINQNLARVCAEFGLGMGLGSCRPLLEDKRWEDFDLRGLLKPETPLYTNFGIAQLEQLQDDAQVDKLNEITKKLRATGIIIHVNPLQEYAQPEGDRYRRAAIESITRFLDQTTFPVIVKEVGQGMGPLSLAALAKLPLAAIEFGAFGGTNFTLLEQLRQTEDESARYKTLTELGRLGHSASQMIDWLNNFEFDLACKQFIVSGGVKNPVQGFVLHKELKHSNVIGMASAFLKYAMDDYEQLQQYASELIQSFELCEQFLKG